MKSFPQLLTFSTAALLVFSSSGCKKAVSEKPATVSTVAKEKHTKTKAHKRDKKEEKEKNGGKKAKSPGGATPEPAKPAGQ